MSTLDTSTLGTVTAELMERIEDEYSERDNATIGVVAVVAEINFAEGDDEVSTIQYRCSDGRRWLQAGLFAAASKAVDYSSERLDEED